MPLAKHTSERRPLSKSLRRQQTIARPCAVSGFGYWSGQDAVVEFHPAPPHTGVVFVRDDVPAFNRIAARVQHRVEVPRRTALAEGAARVEMIEHVMAALAGLQIDNCEVHVAAAEIPGCDGSSQPFVSALLEAGITPQDASRPRLIVTEVTRVGDENAWVEMRPVKGDRLSLTYKLDYGPNHPIGKQSFSLDVTPQSFCSELASARTFLMQEEAEWLRQRGLGTRVTPRDLLVFGPDGVIDNALRYEDECVRHKTLDLVGDLALAGCDLVGQVVACRSGHRLNAELVKLLLMEGRWEGTLRRTG
jgi:UDP-3-O-acyl N-acetylglucosamine deacetylase